jgi:UPF0755 protein
MVQRRKKAKKARGGGVRFLRFLVVLIVLVGLAAAVVGFYAYLPYGPSSETFVEVTPGMGAAGIARQMQEAGVIRSAEAFKVLRAWRRATGTGSQTLKAGEYRFDHAVPMTEVYDRVRKGDVYTISVVIPEGFNIFDVADSIAAAGLMPKEKFLKAEVEDKGLVEEWNPKATSVEGFLFPDTYKFGRKATAEEMLAVMVKRFRQQAKKLGMEVDGAPRGDVAKVVTMASLVEKEVHIDSERPLVAGVFENRLAAGMPLQTDPAVIYASLLRGTWTGVIHQSELHSDSAYNTYAHAGLPPGPICNPGMAALRAAQHPAKTDYLYFVATASGATKFASTIEEHNANVEAYRAGK